MLNWFDKSLMKRLVVVAAAGIAVFVIFRMPDEAVQSQKFGIARDFILFICSTAITWVISSWFAKKESNEKIDTIAERSFEKMALLTLQIERAKKFLVDTIKLSQSDSEKLNPVAGLLSYKHRINGTIATLDQISTSNDTFRADWLGVVSPQMKKVLEERVNALASLPALLAELNRSQSDPTESGVDAKLGSRISEVERAVTGAGRLIDDLVKTSKPKVARITQVGDEGNSPKRQSGTLTISVERLTFRATGSGKIDPQIDGTAEVTIKIVKFPETISEDGLKYPVGVGAHSDFHINMQSAISGVALPIGDYVFEYEVKSV